MVLKPTPLVRKVQFSFVQSLSRVQLFATPWTEANQASLSITNSQSLLKLMSIKLVILPEAGPKTRIWVPDRKSVV